MAESKSSQSGRDRTSFSSSVSLQLDAALTRATLLRAQVDSAGSSDRPWMHEALQEIATAHEELRVAEEELHSKADALMLTEHSLAIERRCYRDLFESAPDAYLLTDSHANILEANRRACQLLNIERNFLLGKPLAVFVSQADRRVLHDMLSLVCGNAESSTFELHIRPRNASETLLTVARVSPSLRSDPLPGGLRWILREERLELSAERAGRARADANAQRYQHRLEFVAHELRSPLQSASGWLEVLAEQNSNGEDRDRITTILQESVQTMTLLVEELLDHARIVEDVIKLRPCEVDLRELLLRVCEETRVLMTRKQLTLSVQIDDDIGSLTCDPLRVRQLLANLLNNAIKFTPPGGQIQLFAGTREGAVELVVQDDGCGIELDCLSRIFEPFVRLDSDDATGLGLGLDIARRLVGLHNGSLVAESAGPGRGTTFRVRLPLS